MKTEIRHVVLALALYGILGACGGPLAGDPNNGSAHGRLNGYGNPNGNGSGGGTGVGGGAGGGSTSGSCTDGSLRCVNADGNGAYACISPTTSTGVPANAPTCRSDSDCPADYSCWGNSTAAYCLQNCNGSGAGVGGGAGGGSASGSCTDASLSCVKADDNGDYECISPTTSTGLPANAPTCKSNSDCPANYSCWGSGTAGHCLQNCNGSGAGVGGGAGGGSTGGSCTDASLRCVNADGNGTYECISPTTSTGVPANAPTCKSDSDCPASYSCWGNSTAAYCLQNCNGSGAGAGGGAGGGSASGSCTDTSLSCVNADGNGSYECISQTTSTGAPANAKACNSDSDCAANYSCWGDSTAAYCLQNCTPH